MKQTDTKIKTTEQKLQELQERKALETALKIESIKKITEAKEQLRALQKQTRLEEKLAKENEKKLKEQEKQAEKERLFAQYRASLAGEDGEEFKEWTRDGYPKCTIGNVATMLNNARIQVRYNVIKKDEMIEIPNSSFLIETKRTAKLNFLVSLATSLDMATSNVLHFIGNIASSNPYNPVEEWIKSKPWDGVSRLQAFYDSVVSPWDEDPELKPFKETLMRKWLTSAVYAAMSEHGIKAQGMLVFQGDQGMGKSTWFASFAPKELEVIRVEATVNPRDKDSVVQVASFWLVELGELDATFKRSDIAALKSFVTNDRDILRKPFERGYCEMPRRTVFFATVNKEDFLVDETGNRRFWSIPVDSLDIHHGIEIGRAHV